MKFIINKGMLTLLSSVILADPDPASVDMALPAENHHRIPAIKMATHKEKKRNGLLQSKISTIVIEFHNLSHNIQLLNGQALSKQTMNRARSSKC